MSSLTDHAIAPLLERQRQRCGPLLEIRNPQQRLARLVHDARQLPPLEAALRLESNRVEGCLVRVWFVATVRDGRCFFRCDSDAVSLKAVGGLLCELYSGFAPRTIAESPGGVLQPLGILHQLAENRQRTIARLEEKIRRFAQDQLLETKLLESKL